MENNSLYTEMKHIKKFEELTESQMIDEAFNPPLLSVLSAPSAINFYTDPKDSKKILLAQRDKSGRVIPGTTHRYSIEGKYGLVGFDVKLRNVRRDKIGNLLAEATPTGFMASKLMKLLPSKDKTTDGWLYVKVPVQKLNDSIAQLRKNQGDKASIDAGQGVTVKLEYVGPVS